MPEDTFRAAAAPLFAAGEVDAVEWSFEMGWHARLAPWLAALLAHYGAAGRLFGHGVHYSPLSAVWEARQARWLDALTDELNTRSYVHVSEHYGFMTARPFGRGAPLPLPRGPATLAIGRDRLRRLRARLGCPLGLENLALAWNRREALAHGAFLDALLERADDFLVLDVHNLYCQAMNFDIPADVLLASFPLARARELHVSGGSWLGAWPGSSELVRCDTHDERVPAAVFDLLRSALAACPNVRLVVFERLGATIASDADAEAFQEDFQRVRAIVNEAAPAASLAQACTSVAVPPPVSSPADDQALARFQSALLSLLVRRDLPPSEVRRRLARDRAFAPFRADTEAFDSKALGIASRVVQKWARRTGETTSP
jgi:uncharacterized protein (UPF0276 family)